MPMEEDNGERGALVSKQTAGVPLNLLKTRCGRRPRAGGARVLRPHCYRRYALPRVIAERPDPSSVARPLPVSR